MNKKILSHILAVIIMIIWGLSYLSIKVVVTEIEPIQSAFYRFLIASIVLFIILKIKYPDEKILKEDRKKIILGALFGITLYFLFENYSVKFTSASNVAILISTIPIFMLVVQKFKYNEKMGVFKILGAFLSVLGIIIVIASKERISLFSKGSIGDFMVLGAVICWVMYNIFSSNLKKDYKSITIITYQSIAGCIMLSPSLFFSNITLPSTKVVINLLFLALFCSCMAYMMYIYCLKNLGATIITTYINLQPLVSLVSAKLLLNELITKYQVIGCIIIILGVMLVSLSEKIKIKHEIL